MLNPYTLLHKNLQNLIQLPFIHLCVDAHIMDVINSLGNEQLCIKGVNVIILPARG